jgi:hypothetical protein
MSNDNLINNRRKWSFNNNENENNVLCGNDNSNNNINGKW